MCWGLAEGSLAASATAGDGWGLCCRCAGSPEAGPLAPEHAALLTSFAKAVVRRMQALKFVQLDPVSLFLPSALSCALSAQSAGDASPAAGQH